MTRRTLVLLSACLLLCDVSRPRASGQTDSRPGTGPGPAAALKGLDREKGDLLPAPRLPKRAALCIGIDAYAEKGKYPPLKYAVADARALAQALRTRDYERVIEMKDAPPDVVATVLFRRACLEQGAGRSAEALAGFTRSIATKGAPVEMVVIALVSRGMAYQWFLRKFDEAAADYQRVIEMKGAPAGDVARARELLAQLPWYVKPPATQGGR